ncbi:MAG: L-rhamnose-proton symporter [candidate division BRC1 bacterium ADurb.BinA292]|nr:MAG: L-rhamnose-proton symporter [candidate division BRC1 bacterium ADurb.BinA292]
MTQSVLLGLLIVVLAAVFQGSFMVPMAYARGWKWENSWLVFSVLGMVVFNWLFARMLVPSLGEIFAAATFGDLVVPALSGLLWGIGAVCFGLGMAAVGFALGYAFIMGLVLSLGAFIPMVVNHPEEIASAKGLLILLGLATMIGGIAISGLAGIRKEREQGARTGEITKTTNLSMKIGLVICVFAGIFSCLPNIGFDMSRGLMSVALAHGAPEQWAGNVIWAVLFTFGGLANLIYCGYLLKKNGTAGAYGGAGMGRNLGLLALMSAMWIGSFVLYGMGARMMGAWGTVIGWSVFIALAIAVGALWGIAQGEWRNTSAATRRLMLGGVAVLVLAIFVFAYSGSL